MIFQVDNKNVFASDSGQGINKNKTTSEDEIIKFCKVTLAGFKLPKKVVFCELPKTSTGKIQKFELRKKVKELS